MFIQVDKLSRKAIYEQIVDGVTEHIRLGLLKEGDRLPSVRELSAELQANPNTVQKAYLELDRMGVIASAPGRGSFVTSEALPVVRRQQLERLGELPPLIRELKEAGVSKDDLLRMIDDVYSS